MKHPLPQILGRSVTRIHCVGVGGMGLGPLAIFLSRLGFTVSGEDDAMGGAMRAQLVRGGVRVGPLHPDCEVLAVSSAIAPTHPAAVEALRLGIPQIRRGELLAAACAGRRLVAVCGAHGKTTTTGMIIHALRRAGLKPGYVLGGLFNDEALSPAEAGSDPWVVAEVDESDGTITAFSPDITVLTNLDWDHPDFYRTREQLVDTFRGLFARTATSVLVSAACAFSREIAPAARRLRSFGILEGDYACSLDAETIDGLSLTLGGVFAPRPCAVGARGRFNALNAVAALGALHEMGVEYPVDVLADYPGVRRRQCRIGTEEPWVVIEDYAHHPAEIAALLGSLRTQVPDGARLVAVFQPHRYSRTAQFRDGFVEALSLADAIHLLEVYSAGEAPVEGGRCQDLAAAFPKSASVQFHGEDGASCFRAIGESLKPGDWLAVVGAGDIDMMARRWLAGRRWDRWFETLRALPLSPETKLSREENLGPRTTIKVGGAARVYAEPACLEDLRALLLRAKADGIPVFPLGRGSNLLVPDEGVEGLVLCLNHATWSAFEPCEDGRVWVGAGLRLKNLCGLAAKAGLSGFEFMEGIPGCVGGSLRMNAGAMGGWIFNVVDEVQLITLDGDVRTVPTSEMGVDYRQCRGLDRAIALGARLRPAAPGAAEAISQQIDAYRKKRQASQPREPSAGCIFKNPTGDSAGRIIDQCGLKGERVGDALVSPVHANFIVNCGDATAGEVISLVRRVRARVRSARGIDLEPEVLLFGSDWSQYL